MHREGAAYEAAYRDYWANGFACIPGFFSAGEMRRLSRTIQKVQVKANRHPANFRYKNVCFRLAKEDRGHNGTNRVRMVQWPAYFEPGLDRIRLDLRFKALLTPLLGPDIKQIINQIHWKPAGAAETSFDLHQDIRFRRPRSAYRNPEKHYIQTALAIDSQGPENGAVAFLRGSHKLGELAVPNGKPVLGDAFCPDDVRQLGLDPKSLVTPTMAPGDLAFWNVYTVHASGPNNDPHSERRLYINGYVSADACDRGEWAFRKGVPVPLSDPVLVHYDDLYGKPGPLYFS